MKTFFLVGAALLLAMLAGCRQPCSPSNCTGCCDAAGSCQLGNTPLACGVSGNVCTSCAFGSACNLGQCFGGTGAGGGGGGTSGGGGGTSGGGTGGGTTGGGSASGGGGGTWTITTVCEAYYREYYALYVRCGAVTQAYVDRFVASYTSLCGVSSPGLKDGRVVLNPPAIDRCLASLRASTCTSASSAGCEDVVTGTVGLNGACYETGDCQNAYSCDDRTTCPGTCIARVPVGQSPGINQQCVKTAFLYNGVCVALVPSGQSCAPMGGSLEKLTCAPPATCQSSELCGVTTYAGLNAACSDTVVCGVGLQCVNGTCAAYGTLNAPCDSARQCQGGLACSTANVCVDASPGALGSQCSFDRSCDATGFCDVPSGSSTGTCVALRGLNATCTGYGQCRPEYVCKGPQGASVCGTPPRVGEPCAYMNGSDVCTDSYCTASSTMTTGVCANKKAESATCTDDRECQSYDCVNARCTRPSCEDPTP